AQSFRAITSAALPAVATRWSSSSRMSRRLSRASASSSITRIPSGGTVPMGSARAGDGPLLVRPGELLELLEQRWDVEGLVADRIGPLGEDPFDELIHLRTIARDQDGAGLRVRRADHLEHRAAVAVGDPHVDQHDLEHGVLELVGRLAAVVRQADAEAA